MTHPNQNAIVDQLTRLGWTPLNSTAIASKTYATAVGPKDAHVYLADFGPESEQLMLQGDYYSEGRNVLESCCTLVPKIAVAEQVSALVAWFAERCEAAVADSYAVRLMH